MKVTSYVWFSKIYHIGHIVLCFLNKNIINEISLIIVSLSDNEMKWRENKDFFPQQKDHSKLTVHVTPSEF